MTNKNTMTKLEYVFETFTMLPFLIFFYNYVFFKNIEPLTRGESLMVFYIMLAVSVVTGFAVTFKKRRNTLSILVNFFLPASAYTLIAYSGEKPRLILVAVAVAAVASALYTVFILSQHVANNKDRARIQIKRFLYALKGCRTLTAACFTLAVAHIFLSATVFGTVFSSAVSPAVPSEEWTAEKCIDTLKNFSDERWSALSSEEKISAMQTVANIEAAALNLPHELTVNVGTINGNAVAYYSDSTHLIMVSIDSFAEDSPLELLDSLCHEAYHAYEHRLVDAYLQVDEGLRSLSHFEKAITYMNEFENYNSGDDDYYTYYFQRCESDARYYAVERVDFYRTYITAKEA